jgi:hypothetical protein
MGSEQHESANAYVIVTEIAASLRSVANIAWKVSIAAKNAKAISARAGGVARGFQPITDHIDEIANEARRCVRDINHLALDIARTTVDEDRANSAHVHFSLIYSRFGHVAHIRTLDPVMAAIIGQLGLQQDAFNSKRERLSGMLHRMIDLMRSANSVAALCRIEAAMANEYRDNLTGVADELAIAAELIQEKTNNSLRRLDAL